jgi:tight adherence protein B
MTAPEIILFVGASVAFVAGLFALLAVLGARRKKFNKRCASLCQRLQSQAHDGAATGDLRRTDPKRFSLVEALVNSVLPKPEILRARLDRTGKRISVGGYAGASLLAGAVVGVAAALAGGLDLLPASLSGLAAGYCCPTSWLAFWVIAAPRHSRACFRTASI